MRRKSKTPPLVTRYQYSIRFLEGSPTPYQWDVFDYGFSTLISPKYAGTYDEALVYIMQRLPHGEPASFKEWPSQHNQTPIYIELDETGRAKILDVNTVSQQPPKPE